MEEVKSSHRTNQEKFKINEEQKTHLEQTVNSLRSENQKIEFKLAAMEAELTSQQLINANYKKELEEYRKNLKVLRDKFEEYSHIKEQEAKNMKEELIILNNKRHTINGENDLLKIENEIFRNDFEKVEKDKIEEDQEKNIVKF